MLGWQPGPRVVSIEAEDPVSQFGYPLQGWIVTWRVQKHHGVLCSLLQRPGDRFFQLLVCLLVEEGVVLHYDDGVMSLLQDGHQLEGGEGPADVEIGEPAVQTVKNPRMVPGHVQDLEPLKLQVGVKSVNQHLRRRHQEVEGSREYSQRWMKLEFHGSNLGILADIRPKTERSECDPNRHEIERMQLK